MSRFGQALRTIPRVLGEGFGPRGSTLAFNLFGLSRLMLRGSTSSEVVVAARVPRRIWIYWAQGFGSAPPLVRRCMESWAVCNPGWTVEILDEATANRLVDLSDLGPGLSIAHKADILRLRLLEAHGGVWVDATCLCLRPLDGWIDVVAAPGFFVFSRPTPDRLVANWFIAAVAGDCAISAWQARATRYWAGRTGKAPFYTATHYAFHWLALTDGAVSRLWRRATKLSADPFHLAQRLLRGQLEETEDRLVALSTAPLQKLSWKYGIESEAVDALLERSAAAVARLSERR